MLEFADEGMLGPKIKVVGVGGGGGNAVNTMIEAGIQGVDFIAANTDGQVLETNLAPTKVQIGRSLTKGLGAGANPEIGAAAAIEDAARLADVLSGADMVFVTAGMGGGTGTGAAPVIAQVARDMGALTVGVVTKPFTFEGLQRKKKANTGIESLGKSVDALIVIPNNRLVALAGMKMTMRESFAMVDNVCLNAVRGISDLVMVPGLINVDFADVRTIMTGMGRALMGSGRGVGDKRAIEAAETAINSPLLEDVSINGATGILVNITGGADLTLAEVNEACSLIQEAADPDANIIFGSVIDPNCGDEVRITVIATGFQTRLTTEVQPHGSNGRAALGGRRPHDVHQMAVPNHPPAAYAHQHVGYAPIPPGYGPPIAATSPAAAATTPYPASPLGTPYSHAVAGEIDHPEAVVPEGYPTHASFVHAPLTAHVSVAPSADWSAGAPERTIRPAVPSPLSSNGAGQGHGNGRRTGGGNGSAMAGDDLGIEESEYDTPAYLRRARASQERTPQAGVPAWGGDYGGGYRMPGEK